MEFKTQISAEEGKQELFITRSFDLPLALLFKAHSDPEIIEQWMGTKVLRLENTKHGSWQYETSHNGKVVFRANGTILEFVPNEKITRTFEMENSSFPVQLEFFEFKPINEDKSELLIQIVFKSVASRDQLLKMPFAGGLNMAHNRLEEMVTKMK